MQRRREERGLTKDDPARIEKRKADVPTRVEAEIETMGEMAANVTGLKIKKGELSRVALRKMSYKEARREKTRSPAPPGEQRRVRSPSLLDPTKT